MDTTQKKADNFSERYSWIFEFRLADPDQNPIIYICEIDTPLGPMLAAATGQGICLLEFINRVKLVKEITELQILLQANIIPERNEHLNQLEKELLAYFGGHLKNFSLPLHIPGNAFSQTVWQSLLEIPYGKTWTYKEQAERMKNPKAIRAIASTNGRNRIAILIPCHRVIGSNGKLTG